MMKKKITYKEAFSELQEIANKLENEDMEVDLLSINIKRASELVQICKEKLKSIEKDVKNELTQDL